MILILFLAGFLADRSRRLGEWGTVLAAVGLGLLPAFLVFIEPDFGTALMYVGAARRRAFLRGRPVVAARRARRGRRNGCVTLLWLFPRPGSTS